MKSILFALAFAALASAVTSYDLTKFCYVLTEPNNAEKPSAFNAVDSGLEDSQLILSVFVPAVDGRQITAVDIGTCTGLDFTIDESAVDPANPKSCDALLKVTIPWTKAVSDCGVGKDAQGSTDEVDIFFGTMYVHTKDNKWNPMPEHYDGTGLIVTQPFIFTIKFYKIVDAATSVQLWSEPKISSYINKVDVEITDIIAEKGQVKGIVVFYCGNLYGLKTELPLKLAPSSGPSGVFTLITTADPAPVVSGQFNLYKYEFEYTLPTCGLHKFALTGKVRVQCIKDNCPPEAENVVSDGTFKFNLPAFCAVEDKVVSEVVLYAYNDDKYKVPQKAFFENTRVYCQGVVGGTQVEVVKTHVTKFLIRAEDGALKKPKYIIWTEDGTNLADWQPIVDHDEGDHEVGARAGKLPRFDFLLPASEVQVPEGTSGSIIIEGHFRVSYKGNAARQVPPASPEYGALKAETKVDIGSSSATNFAGTFLPLF
jgi:hypothetical protein